jgi:hypothetical protein
MVEIKENFGFGTGICANGAMLYDFNNEKVLEEWLFPVKAQLETVKRLREVLPPVSFAVEVRRGPREEGDSRDVPHVGECIDKLIHLYKRVKFLEQYNYQCIEKI